MSEWPGSESMPMPPEPNRPSVEDQDTVRAQLVGRSVAGLFWLVVVVLTCWTFTL